MVTASTLPCVSGVENEARRNINAVFISEQEDNTPSLSSVITRWWNTYCQTFPSTYNHEKKIKKNGTIMFCLPHFHLQKNSQLKPHGWNNINALFRSGEHAHFWINHNPFWKTWKHFFSCLCVSVWTMGTVSKAQTKYPLQMFLLSFWVSSLLQTVFI